MKVFKLRTWFVDKYEQGNTKGALLSTMSLGFLFTVILLMAISTHAAVIHSWDFKSATGSQFLDVGSGTAQHIAQTTNYINNDYGVHLSYQSISLTTADIFKDLTFTIYGSFFTHVATSFYLFWEQNGAVDRFCLSSNSAGYYAISMTDSTGSQQYLVSTIQAKSGLNFFYIQVWQEFGYTKMSLNVANENNSPTKLSQTLTFNGVYIKSSQTFNIGCRKVNSACTFPFIGAIRSLVIDDTVVATATLDALYSTTCSNDGVSSCGLCIVSGTGKCIEVLESTPKIKYVSLNIAAATTATSSILDTSGDSHNFGISTDYPFRIPEQGYVFAKDKYIKATTGFTLPEVFTVNLWFRMNTLVTVPDSQMQYLYLKTDSAGTTNKLFIGVTNSYLRIYIEGGIYDYVHAFSSNSNWRYLSVGFYKTSSSTTGIQIFLDMTKVSTQSIPKAFTDNSAYNVYVGKDFEGAINSFEIIPILYSELSVPPLLVTSGWTAYGATSSWTVCPRTSPSAGACLSHCSFGTYDSNCNTWDWKWDYWTASGANCISCASSLDGTGAAPRTCTCRNGYFDNTTSCVAWDSLWGTCNGALSTNCLTCANDAYSNGVSTWVSSCPTYYTANANLRKCQLDTASLLTYVNDSTSIANGCSTSQYWDGSACQSWHAEWLTWNGSANTNWLSCPLGRYLNSNSWPVWDATHMIVGSSGLWVETCGKSKNFGLLDWDNGGAVGWTSCTIEDGYTCQNGSPTAPDVWTYNLATFASTNETTVNSKKVTIKEIIVTEQNNLYLYFDREMQAVGNITSDTFTITVQDNDGTAISGVGWEVPSNYYKEFSEDGSARYIYISLTIPKTFGGGSNAPTVTVVYQNVSGTGAFKDLNNQFMLNGTSASGKLNVQYGDLSSTQELIVTVLGSIVSFFIILGITVPLILGLKGGSTEGMIFTALTMQAIYFSSLINFVFPPMFSGFMQYLRISTLELDSAPNVFIEYLIDEGSRSKYLIRTDDMNYYKIANLIEFSSLKLLILFTFNIIFVALLLSLICLKKKRSKILAILENMKYKGFLLMFAIMFVPLEFSWFGERQNMEKTSPYKIVSGTSAFLFIFISYLGIFTLSKLILTNSIQTDRKVQERFNVLQMGSKKTKKVLVMFYPIILMKMILIVTATVHLSNTVGAFGIIAFLIQLLSIGFFIYYRPFKELKSKSKLKFLLNSNALAITTEVTLSLYYFLFTLYSNTSPSLTETICLLQLSLISLLSISTCTIGIYCSYKNLILYKYSKLTQFDEDQIVQEYNLDQLDEEFEEEQEEEEEEYEIEVEELDSDNVDEDHASNIYDYQHSEMLTKKVSESKEMPHTSNNLFGQPTNLSIDNESKASSKRSMKRRHRGKKRTKAAIGYAGDDRINAFESVESDNTDDDKK